MSFFVIDRGVIEIFGPDGFLRVIRKVWPLLTLGMRRVHFPLLALNGQWSVGIGVFFLYS